MTYPSTEIQKELVKAIKETKDELPEEVSVETVTAMLTPQLLILLVKAVSLVADEIRDVGIALINIKGR